MWHTIIDLLSSKRFREWSLTALLLCLTSGLVYRSLFFSGSMLIPLFSLAVLAVFILWRPIIGISIYLFIYPLMPSSASVDLMKTGMLALTVFIIFIWWWQNSRNQRKPWMKPEYRWIYIFFIYLCVSPLLGIKNGFSPVDWARDISPMLNLLLIPVFVDYLNDSRYRWLPLLVFVPWFVGTLQSMIDLLSYYGFFPVNVPWPLMFRYFHPSHIVGLGFIMMIYDRSRRRWWLLFAALGLLFTALTPGRTIWIAVIIMIFLVIYFTTRYRALSVIIICLLILVTGWMIYRGSNIEYSTRQAERMESLEDYQHDSSFRNRMDEIHQSYALFLSAPLFGVGFGFQYHFWRTFIQNIGPGYLDTNFMHTDILFVLSKGGIIGLIVFIIAILSLMKKMNERRRIFVGDMRYTFASYSMLILFISLFLGLSTPIIQSRTNLFILTFILSFGLSNWGEHYNRPWVVKTPKT